MSYLALARKWRPRRFEDVRGQDPVVKALTHALARDALHPAILFTGTRGVGKTTLARLVAKGLNCETGVTAQPCGVCSACREINDGRFVDLLEIDAASNTGVDDVRQLIDNAQYAPARGRYKVYLIDEVHMLSRSAFNALLKTLEEPPPHVKFILATTDPQRLPVTVLSRCLQFNLKRLPPALIRQALADILREEKIDFEPGAVEELARAADGSLRDGLSLLDQAIAFSGGGALAREPIEEMLGTGGRRALFELLEALASGDGAALVGGLDRLAQTVPDYAALLNELAAKLQRIAVLQLMPDVSEEDDDARLRPLAQRFAPEDVQVYYQIAVLGRRDLPWAPDPRLGFEMTWLRMYAFRPELESGDRGPGEALGEGSNRARAARSETPASAAPRSVPAPATSEVAIPPERSSPIDAQRWSARIETLGLDGMTRQLARHCVPVGETEDELRLALDAHAKHLLVEDRRGAIERALAAQTSRRLRVSIEVGVAGAGLSPAGAEAAARAERQRAAEAAIEDDPQVQALKAAFGVTVRPGSVQPLDGQ